jgi:3'-phosphoadenosine 5'-phosphosulfate sulfotransferase (PAPS reductase)/FAD synthetase
MQKLTFQSDSVPRAPILSALQIKALGDALEGRALALCFGSGVDSTAMLVALHTAGIRPDVITFADTGGEKPETIKHIDLMNAILSEWGWPLIDVCRKVPIASAGYAISTAIASQTRPYRPSHSE